MVANTLFSGYVGHNENWWHILHKTSQHMKASQVYSSGWVVEAAFWSHSKQCQTQ